MLIKVDWNSKKSLKEAIAPKLNDNFWKWFGNSKVVDEKGKPLVVYHGSSKLFNTFKQMKSKSGQLGSDLGFWFSDNENIAKQFSNNAFVLDTDKKTYNEYIKSDEYNNKIKDLKKKNEITLEDIIELYKDIVNKDNITNDELEYLKNISSLKIEDIKEKKYRAVFQIYNMNLNHYKEDLKALNNEIKRYFSKDKDKPTVYKCYLNIQNPLIVKGEDIGVSWQRYSVISSAIDEGYDGVIIINGDTGAGFSNEYIVFNPNQIKSVDNNGEWSLTSDNINEWWSGGVNWQNDREGLGGVGATMDCHLFFFMFPDQFLNLCPKFSYGDDEFFNQYVADRKPMGIPFLWCEVDEKNKTLKVFDHEGRHRVKAIRSYAASRGKSQPDIPVAIIYNKDKYRLPVDLTELRKNWKIVGQKGDRTYNVGQFRVQNNLDNARIGLDNLYESIESAYMDKNGNMFEIHKNPSDKELKDLLKISKGKALRVILAKNGDFYVADAYGYDHDSMEDDLKISGYRGWYDENGFSVVDNGLDYFDDNIIEGVINVLKKYYQKFGKEVFDNFIKTIKFHKQNNPEYYKKFIITNPLIKDLLNNKLTESSEPNLNDNFWNRFKDSKPVDVNVYHGSPNVFKKFDKEKLGTSTKKFEDGDYTSSGYGFFFTDDKEYASGYGENIYSCKIKLDNPLVVDMSDYIATEEVLSKFLQQAKNENKDGVIFKNIREVGRNTSTEYVVFNSDNIKILNKLTESQEPNLNQNFWNWFGNSKVVDKQGNPLVVYHGSLKTFNQFKSNSQYYDIKGNPIVSDKQVLRKIIWFSDNKNVGEGFGSQSGTLKNLYSCFLKIENPFIYDAKNNQWNAILELEILKKCPMSCDGIIIKNIKEGSSGNIIANDYIVFNPNQIKSVNNNGNWSSTSNNINETLTEASNINQNFWNWFRGSKTVDEQGNPLIFYHGTKQPNITNFKAKYSDGLIFFAYNEEFAKQWASHAPLTPEQEEKTREFIGSDDLANYRKEVMARYKRDYGDNWADDDDIRNTAKWEIKEYEKQKYKQMGIEENVIPVYIRATKIFNPARDYELVLDKIAEHFDMPLKPMFDKEVAEAENKFNKIHDVLMKWLTDHRDWIDDPILDKEVKKRENILDNAFKELEAVRAKNKSIQDHLKRIQKGAWIYFENPETINKIWELGYDAIELAEHDGEISTLAVREGTNQIKSIFNDGSWSDKTNIFENF